MKSFAPFLALAVILAGCAKHPAESTPSEDAATKARAEAAQKEMETLPKAFSSPQFFQRADGSPTPTQQPK